MLATLALAVWLGGFVWGTSTQGWDRYTIAFYLLAPVYVPLLAIGALAVFGWVAQALRL